LIINTEANEKIKAIKVIDISGRVYNLPYVASKVNQAQINVSGLANGSYSAVISTENRIVSYKFIVIK